MKLLDGNVGPQNASFVERLYRRYLEDARAVSGEWRRAFGELPGEPLAPRAPSLPPPSIFDGAGREARASDDALQERAERLAQAYLELGHRAAAVDPLGRSPREPRELAPGFHGLSAADLDRTIASGDHRGGARSTLRSVLERLRECYCGPIGVELTHLHDREARAWLRRRMEEPAEERRMERAQRVRLLERLTDATVFEEFVRKRFVGSKSYSLEGAETLLLLLDAAVDRAGELGLDDIVLAMAHRGRLNVLANLMDREPRLLFRDLRDEGLRDRGDLGHHLGASTDRKSASGRGVHLSLCFNPSHLEVVGPIALGRARARQDRQQPVRRGGSMALVVHGDAAFAGEGVVQELFNLSSLAAYETGGALHVVLDNQIGFTTPPEEGRSSAYATDAARALGVPVFHVNGDEPEAVVRVAEMAVEFRRRFRRDVVVDLLCYRRWGHNEIDEPRFTQPLMYALIEDLQPVRDAYRQRLLEAGAVTRDEAERMVEVRWQALQHQLDAVEDPAAESPAEPGGAWSGYRGGPVSRREEVRTEVEFRRIRELLESLARLPAGFHAHAKVEKLLKARREMAGGEEPLDWATAEALALASLCTEGVAVRFIGQDTSRGTFSQRHASLVDQQSGERYEPLGHLAPDQEPVEVGNSPLSELGALGFEYGYSLDRPSALVLWEAQFGDFANAAQVVIDQFIATAEDKWRRLSGIVLLLPHGFEGQGPEHSSARLERYLQACAEDNIQVVQPTTPAQYFHVLRRQALQRWRKPLVVLTPKSLLRHGRCVSDLEQLAEGSFRPVLGDPAVRGDVDRVLLCTGKLYYELVKEREARGREDVAIVRLEELHPFPQDELREALGSLGLDTPVVWTQEEPENMGAWTFLRSRFPGRIVDRFPFRGVCRAASASPAGGSAARFRETQAELLGRAFEETS